MRALQVGGGLPRRGKAGSESSWRPQVGQPVALEHGTNNRLQFVHIQIPSLFSPESPAAARGVAGGGALCYRSAVPLGLREHSVVEGTGRECGGRMCAV